MRSQQAALERYAERHNLDIISYYTTMGTDEGPSNHRAHVRDRATGAHMRLYYDRSRKTMFSNPRGWRNATLDNRRRNAKRKALQNTPRT